MRVRFVRQRSFRSLSPTHILADLFDFQDATALSRAAGLARLRDRNFEACKRRVE